MRPKIELNGLWKAFGGQHVLCGVDLSVREGETLVVIGRSGCGKSVMLKHMVGLIKPDSGMNTFKGRKYKTIRRTVLRYENVSLMG